MKLPIFLFAQIMGGAFCSQKVGPGFTKWKESHCEISFREPNRQLKKELPSQSQLLESANQTAPTQIYPFSFERTIMFQNFLNQI